MTCMRRLELSKNASKLVVDLRKDDFSWLQTAAQAHADRLLVAFLPNVTHTIKRERETDISGPLTMAGSAEDFESHIHTILPVFFCLSTTFPHIRMKNWY